MQMASSMFSNPSAQPNDLSPYLRLNVSRNSIIYDTLQYINNSSLNLKKPLKVSFIGEPGVDEGGVRKEFFQLLVR